MSVCVTACAARTGEARRIAGELRLAFQDTPLRCGVALHFSNERVELREMGEGAPGPVYVDWIGGTMGYRLEHGGGRGQAIARAIGIKAAEPAPRVLDATGGLGRDAFMLAALGARVTCVERSAPLFVLLQDGWRRAREHPEVGEWLGERLELVHADARLLLGETPAGAYDAIYLDPMHPERKKSALVKKEMRVLRLVAGDDADARELLDAAAAASPRRIVVKRPIRAEPLAPGAAHSVEGKTTRFDVYVAPCHSG